MNDLLVNPTIDLLEASIDVMRRPDRYYGPDDPLSIARYVQKTFGKFRGITLGDYINHHGYFDNAMQKEYNLVQESLQLADSVEARHKGALRVAGGLPRDIADNISKFIQRRKKKVDQEDVETLKARENGGLWSGRERSTTTTPAEHEDAPADLHRGVAAPPAPRRSHVPAQLRS